MANEIEKELIRKEFETIRDKVLYVLECDEDSRNSDERLFCKFLHEYTPYRVINLSELRTIIKINAKDIFSSFNVDQITKNILRRIQSELSKTPSLNLFPHFSTIRRVRQKIQNQDEIFIPTIPEVAEKRNIRAELIKEYFIEKKKKEEN